MNIDYIIIILGEPNSTFSEILGKYFKNVKKLKRKIVIVGNKNLFEKQLKKLHYTINFKIINKLEQAKKSKVNLININYKFNKIFSNISNKSNKYIEDCFNTSLKIIKGCNNNVVLINGPISKKTFLKKKYLGVTEYLSKKTSSKDEIMLIYNKKFSVSPITTHVPVKYITKKITKDKIIKNVIKLNEFYHQILREKVNFAVLGLNPHCETTDKYSEEEKIIIPAIKTLKKRGLNIDGPFSADTFFLKKNITKYNLVIGMYHDQVLVPIKTLFNFNAINITVGLPFIRISPDHGPNTQMIGKNKSDPSSFYYAMKFVDSLN